MCTEFNSIIAWLELDQKSKQSSLFLPFILHLKLKTKERGTVCGRVVTIPKLRCVFTGLLQ